ncbi:MAG: hypothetical protein EPN39_20090 [Chitinophagaceae bacterium]|nr:MAG: hypothetical protein EPN39_20090 [Chitinophagaceae bacterium]
MNITYLLKYLWGKKWVIILPTIIATAVAWFYFRNEGIAYTSTAEISTGYFEINPLNSNLNHNNTVLFNNVVQTLKSNQVLDQVTYSLLLHDIGNKDPFRKPGDASQLDQMIKQFPGGKAALMLALSNKANSFKALDLSDNNDRLIRRIADIYGYSADAITEKIANIAIIEGSDFIDITATTENPALSAFIANNICRTFLEFYQNKKQQASAMSLDSLQNLVNARKQILESKLKLLPNAADMNNPMGMIGTFQNQLTQQKLDLIRAQTTLDNVNRQISAASKQGGGLANNEDIIALRTSLDNLITQYTNGGSSDPVLADKINGVRKQLQQKLSDAGVGTISNPIGDLLKQKMALNLQVEIAQQTIKDLQTKLNELNNSVKSSVLDQSVAQGIQNEVDAARQGYTQANDLLNQTLNYNIFPGNNFRQTLVASPPLNPDPSKEIKKIAFAGTGVFFALIFILLFFEVLDTSIKSPSYLKENVPLPLLANLKHIGMKSPSLEELFNANGTLPEYKKGFREQVKQLRYEVESSGKRCFLVAGYHAGSGKTTVIRALAGSLSLKNNQVLLVDANFHNNALSKIYGAGEVLETLKIKDDPASDNKMILENVTATNDKNIKIIGCGSGDHTPDEVLPEKNVLQVLKNSSLFDYVLIEGAALSQGPDCKELLKYTEAVLLVYAADQTLTEEDKKLVEFLQKQKVEILGSVLNRINENNLAL